MSMKHDMITRHYTKMSYIKFQFMRSMTAATVVLRLLTIYALLLLSSFDSFIFLYSFLISSPRPYPMSKDKHRRGLASKTSTRLPTHVLGAKNPLERTWKYPPMGFWVVTKYVPIMTARIVCLAISLGLSTRFLSYLDATRIMRFKALVDRSAINHKRYKNFGR